MLTWIKNKWAKFEEWVNSFFPGLKTQIVTGLGFVASFALIFQDFLSGLDLGDLVSPRTLLIINAVLYTLAFWLRNINSRVEKRT